MLLHWIRKIPFLQKTYLNIGDKWVQKKMQTVLPHITGKVLDIGSGNGMVTYFLRRHNHDVIALDVADLSIVPEVKVVVYDGVQIPFPAKTFDTALLLTVLHHTSQPEVVLQEAARVAHRLIIIEDIYTHSFQKYLTWAMDTLVNLGHSSMTYQNKDDKGWKETFQKLGLEIEAEKQKRVLFFFRQATYIVKNYC